MAKNKPMLVGVTGGIGSGKSTICRIFITLGVPVYDADSQAKMLMSTNSNLIKSIKKHFGEKSYHFENGELNRKYLAKTVFSNPSQLAILNALVHPVVAQNFETWVSEQNTPYVIKEAALLIESGSYKQLNKLINVYAPIDLRIKRIQQRDPFRSVNEIKKIISNQLSEVERNEKSDFVIKNDETELLVKQVLNLHREFMKK